MAMRKVFYGPEGIMLNHVIRLYDKESLLNYAKDLEIKRTSGLKKGELAEKIANELLLPSVMRRRIATFSPECRALLERAMREPFVPASEEKEDALCLHESDYAFLNKQGQLNVPVDVKNAYEKLNTPEFRKYARKMSWLSQCLDFGDFFYGVFDKDILLEVFNTRKGFHISPEELEKLCNEFPSDMTECHMEREQKFIVIDDLAYDGRYKELLGIQSDKDFYIPDYQEVLDYAKNFYLLNEPAYENYRKFLQHEIGMTYEESKERTLEIWDKIQFNIDFPAIVQYVIDFCGELLDDHKMGQLIQLLQELKNNTRMRIHRGHTPNEILKKEIERGHFAQSDSFKKVDSSSRKIYPNDPCPCGSGKKFKKCCGKQNR